MSIAIPTPGGAKVGVAKFVPIALGAALGIGLAQAYLLPALPEAAYQWNLGPVPINGVTFWSGVGALLGGAAGAMISAKL